MKKSDLINYIQKYYLGGFVNAVQVISSKEGLLCKFITPTKDLVGIINKKESFLPHGHLYIYNTSQLLKLISILGEDITVNYEGGKVPTKKLISDSVYDITYPLSDPILINSKIPDIKEGSFDFSIPLNTENKNKILKVKNSIDTENIWIGPYKDISDYKIQFTFGDNAEHNNKISFYVPPKDQIQSFQEYSLPFSLEYLKEILSSNKDIDGELFLNQKGLMKIVFETSDISIVYYLIRKNI